MLFEIWGGNGVCKVGAEGSASGVGVALGRGVSSGGGFESGRAVQKFRTSGSARCID